jgi:hypothetical protein
MVVAKADAKLCRYHDPALREATIARNRIALRRYWERWRAERDVGPTRARERSEQTLRAIPRPAAH